jgi:oxygen-independent coproporphyrinogen-3 oxidase
MQAFNLQVKHLSCYHLIYESGTPITRRLNSGVLQPVSEDQSVEQFKLLQEVSQQNGFVHYEISNLAKEDFFSRHNSSYWKQIPYLGIGPSSHSFNGATRDWNPRSIAKWKNSIRKGSVALESEVLSPTDLVNDYILTSLRTIWGLDVDFVEKKLGVKALNDFLKALSKYEKLGLIMVSNNQITIKPQHFLLSDGIIADLLFVT